MFFLLVRNNIEKRLIISSKYQQAWWAGLKNLTGCSLETLAVNITYNIFYTYNQTIKSNKNVELLLRDLADFSFSLKKFRHKRKSFTDRLSVDQMNLIVHKILLSLWLLNLTIMYRISVSFHKPVINYII